MANRAGKIIIITHTAIMAESFYIVKKTTETCEIVSEKPQETDETQAVQIWGPFSSAEEAIARRVGLIRSGKCKPV